MVFVTRGLLSEVLRKQITRRLGMAEKEKEAGNKNMEEMMEVYRKLRSYDVAFGDKDY